MLTLKDEKYNRNKNKHFWQKTYQIRTAECAHIKFTLKVSDWNFRYKRDEKARSSLKRKYLLGLSEAFYFPF